MPETPATANGRYSITVLAGDQVRFFRLRRAAGPALTVVSQSAPAHGEEGVAVTRESIFRLSAPLAPDVALTGSDLYAQVGGRRALARPELASDRRTLTLFYLEYLPASARVRVTLDGTRLRDTGGQPLDADGDGQPGGVRVLEFNTAGITGLPGTGVRGYVFDSERNPDGSNRPLANVTVTVDGAEETLRTVTDATGAFLLSPSPSGRFFVHVDGRTAAGSQWPGGDYYPFVGKAWEATAGSTNNLAGGSGEIFLPRIRSDTLRTVSASEDTRVTFPDSIVAANPALAGVEVAIPANSLFSDNGTRGGSVGIAPVAPDRLPEPLPPGLNLPLVITVQTDGAANFDRPVPVRFPNLPDPVTGVKLPPGARTVLWSFNHDTGRWEPQGLMTISADGNFAVSDPGTGIRQPGWHGTAAGSGGDGPGRRGGSSGGGSGGGEDDDCEGDECECTQEITCVTPKPGRGVAICALSCVGDVVDDIFGDGEKPQRTAFETGLRCIGGPDKCPGRPEDTLDKKRRDCMDECTDPEPNRVTYTVPCEGFSSPCGGAAPSLHGVSLHADIATLIPDRLVEQRKFWEVEGDFLIKLTGTAKILESESAEVPLLSAFFDAFSDRVQAAGPNGVRLSASERAELIALPRPAHFSVSDWTAMIDRLDSFQGQPLPAAVATAEQRLNELTAELRRRGWEYRGDGLLHGLARRSRHASPALGSEEFPARSHFYYLKDHRNGFVQRGRLNAAGRFDGLILSPGGYYSVAYLDPVTRRVGVAFFQAREAGTITVVPTAPLADLASGTPDSDADGLADVSEKILGTSATKADSDNDGLSDAQELATGTPLLDGVGLPIGVVASSPTPGFAYDVAAGGNLAVVACSQGLAIFDVSNPGSPIQISVVPGNVTAVALQGSLALAAFTDSVRLVDLSSPANPVTRWSRTDLIAAEAVALHGTTAYIARRTALHRVRTADGLGDVLATAHSSNIESIAPRGDLLYALGDDSRLSVIRTRDFMERLVTLQAPGSGGAGRRPRKLFLDAQRLYAQHNAGFNAFDLSDPAQPLLTLDKSTSQFGWRQFVTTGAGLGLAADGPNSTEDSPHDVSLYRLVSGGPDIAFIATFPTPGSSHALAIAGGRAFVADGASGLAVVNFLAPDLAGIAPTVTVGIDATSVPPRVEGRSTARIAATVSDDIGIHHVDFLIDGIVAGRDDSYPFEIFLPVPAASATTPSVKARVRAVDLAGNVGESPETTVAIVEDATAPLIDRLDPASNGVIPPAALQEVFVSFREAVVSPVGAATLTLLASGPDGLWDTADDAPVPGTVEWIAASRAVRFRAADLFLSGRYRATLAAGIADAAGNARPQPLVWEFAVGAPPTIVTLFPPANLVRVGGTLDELAFGYDAPLPRVLFETYRWQVVYRPVPSGGGDLGPAVTLPEITASQSFDGYTVLLRTAGTFAPGYYVVTGSGPVLNAMRWEFYFRVVPNEAVGADPFTGARWRYHPGVGVGDELIINVPGVVVPVETRDIRSVIAYTDAALVRQRVNLPTPLQFLAGLRIANTTFGPGITDVHGPVTFNATFTDPLEIGPHTLNLRGGGSSRTRVDLRDPTGVILNHPGSTLVLSNQSGFYGSQGVGGRFINLGTVQTVSGSGTVAFDDILLRNDGRLELVTGTTRVENLENEGTTEVAAGSKLMLSARTRAGISSSFTGAGTLEFGEFDPNSRRVIGVADAEIRGDVQFTGNLTLVAGNLTLGRPWSRASGSNEIRNGGMLRLNAPSELASLALTDGNLTCNSDTVIGNLSVDSRADLRSATRVRITGVARMGQGIDVLGGGIVEFAGTTTVTNGTQSGGVYVGHGILRNSGTWRQAINNAQGSFISRVNENGQPGTGVFENTGTFELVTQRPFGIHVPFRNAGRVILGRATVSIDTNPGSFPPRSGIYLPQPGADLVLNNTTIEHGSAGTLDLAAGTLRGIGSVVAVGSNPQPKIINRGMLRPGNPTGTLTLRATAGFEQTATGELVITLGAAGAGNLRLDRTAATLAGTLTVELIDGFSPEIGRTFQALSANTRTGEFTTLKLPSPGAGRKFEVVYGTADVTLRVVAQ